MDYTQHYDSPLGGMMMASDGEALIGLWFDGQRHFAETLYAEHMEKPLPVFEQTAHWLDIYFSGGEPDFTPPMCPRGTDFRKAVWEVLRTVPRGQTLTYGAIAARVGASARAVGGAVGHNPIALIIPCHRVVGADGSLTGYAGGTEKKRQLLELEQRSPH